MSTTRLPDEDILALAETIRQRTNPDECCHGLLFTRCWLAERYGRVDPGTIAWLKSQEVACDCELAYHLAASILKNKGHDVR